MQKTKIILLSVICLFTTLAQATPSIQHWETANGARVLFVEAHDLPMVDVRVVFDAAAARDAGAAGLARLTSTLLDQGAGGLNADQIASGLENLGAELSTGSEKDMAWLSFRSLSESDLLQPALALFKKVLTAPEFPAADFERERQRMLVSAQYRKQKPGSIASENYYKLLYGDHPYASQAGGDETSLKAIKREQLKAFYQQYYVAKNAVVAVVGDLDKAQAMKLVNDLLAPLPAGQHAPALPDVPPLKKSVRKFISHPSTQSHVLMGQPGTYRGDPDYFTLYVGNFILGGSGLVSRISEEVREKRGLSYSAYSYFSPMAKPGPYTLGLQTKNDKRDEAIKVLRDTLQTYLDKGPTEKELVAAKKNITGGFPIRVSSNSKIVEYLAMIGFYGLPLDYLDTFTDNIEAVSRDMIIDAYKRRIHPDKMVTVIVGGEVK